MRGGSRREKVSFISRKKDTTRMIERNLNNDRGHQEHFIINRREQQEHYYQQQRQ